MRRRGYWSQCALKVSAIDGEEMLWGCKTQGVSLLSTERIKSCHSKKEREQLLQQPEEKNLAMRWGVYNKLALGHEECKRQGIPPTCSLQVRRRRTSAPCRGLEKAAKKASESIRRDPLLFQLAFSSSKIALMLSMDLLCLWCCLLGSHRWLQSLMVPQESHYSTHLWHTGGCSAEQSSG